MTIWVRVAAFCPLRGCSYISQAPVGVTWLAFHFLVTLCNDSWRLLCCGRNGLLFHQQWWVLDGLTIVGISASLTVGRSGSEMFCCGEWELSTEHGLMLVEVKVTGIESLHSCFIVFCVCRKLNNRLEVNWQDFVLFVRFIIATCSELKLCFACYPMFR